MNKLLDERLGYLTLNAKHKILNLLNAEHKYFNITIDFDEYVDMRIKFEDLCESLYSKSSALDENEFIDVLISSFGIDIKILYQTGCYFIKNDKYKYFINNITHPLDFKLEDEFLSTLQAKIDAVILTKKMKKLIEL